MYAISSFTHNKRCYSASSNVQADLDSKSPNKDAASHKPSNSEKVDINSKPELYSFIPVQNEKPGKKAKQRLSNAQTMKAKFGPPKRKLHPKERPPKVVDVAKDGDETPWYSTYYFKKPEAHPILKSIEEEIRNSGNLEQEQEDLLAQAAKKMRYTIEQEAKKHLMRQKAELVNRKHTEHHLREVCGNLEFCKRYGIVPDYENEDPYKVLGIPTSVDFGRVKQQYMKLALVFHPDKNKHPDAKHIFCSMTTAYTTLKDANNTMKRIKK